MQTFFISNDLFDAEQPVFPHDVEEGLIWGQGGRSGNELIVGLEGSTGWPGV